MRVRMIKAGRRAAFLITAAAHFFGPATGYSTPW
jgi:hypothetical protein